MGGSDVTRLLSPSLGWLSHWQTSWHFLCLEMLLQTVRSPLCLWLLVSSDPAKIRKCGSTWPWETPRTWQPSQVTWSPRKGSHWVLEDGSSQIFSPASYSFFPSHAFCKSHTNTWTLFSWVPDSSWLVISWESEVPQISLGWLNAAIGKQSWYRQVTDSMTLKLKTEL